jgi:hypothetical protein
MIRKPCPLKEIHNHHTWYGEPQGNDNAERLGYHYCAGIDFAILEPGLALPEKSSHRYALPEHYKEILAEAERRFAEAYAEYGDSSKDTTGLAGQWADLYRKIMKLKAPLWAGEEGRLTRESESTVLFDLIGHALLALKMIQDGDRGGRKP